jgi:hypothetical protein
MLKPLDIELPKFIQDIIAYLQLVQVSATFKIVLVGHLDRQEIGHKVASKDVNFGHILWSNAPRFL